MGDCSHLKADRHHASLLKSNDLPTTPLYIPQNRIVHPTSVTEPIQSSSPLGSCTDSTVSLAKVTTIPRCRDSITSNLVVTPKLTRGYQSMNNPNGVTLPNPMSAVNDETKMTSFFEPISAVDPLHISCNDLETRKNSCRIPLAIVPEMNELDVANSRNSFDPSSSLTLPISRHSHAIQPSPILITFDSGSLKLRN